MGISEKELWRLGKGARAQILKELGTEAKGGKYKNIPTEANGIRFASRKEAGRYEELLALLRAGEIRALKLQPQFTLQESYITPEGERVRAVRYIADFSYERETAPDRSGRTFWLPVVEDVKSRGTKTAQYRLKRKLLRERLGIDITEV